LNLPNTMMLAQPCRFGIMVRDGTPALAIFPSCCDGGHASSSDLAEIAKDYREYYVGLERIFNPLGIKARIAVECDSASSLITEVETGRGVALASPVFKHVSGKRLLYRPLAGINDVVSVGIARAKNGDLTPAGEKFCESLRKASNVANPRATKQLP
jgi:DNA-binding transcriptional LysR family regulator